MQGTRVQSLGWEDPLEVGMATHSSILAWKIPWTEEPGGLQSTRSQSVGHNWSDLAHMQANLNIKFKIEMAFFLHKVINNLGGKEIVNR